VRGTIVLPHGLGKTKTVLVIAQAKKIKEAEDRARILWAARTWSIGSRRLA